MRKVDEERGCGGASGGEAAAPMANICKLIEVHSSILISGLGGLGAEIAKNVILGEKLESVTLHDTSACHSYDLSSQFCLSEAEIGMNRAVASRNKLASLNANVAVKVSTTGLTEDLLKSHRVVVLTNSTREEQLEIAGIVRSYGNLLIVASTRGLFGQIFVDFGPDFTGIDANGERIQFKPLAQALEEPDFALQTRERMTAQLCSIWLSKLWMLI